MESSKRKYPRRTRNCFERSSKRRGARRSQAAPDSVEDELTVPGTSSSSGEPPATGARVQLLRTEELRVPVLLANLPEQLSHKQLARLLWTNLYPLIIACELMQFARVSEPLMQMAESQRSKRQGEWSTDKNAVMRLSASATVLAREKSQRILPFSVVARSISYLMQRIPKRVWAVERKQRRILHTATIQKILDEMLLCRPPPAFEACMHHHL